MRVCRRDNTQNVTFVGDIADLNKQPTPGPSLRSPRKILTGHAGSEEAGRASGNHGPHDDLGQVGLPVGGHGAEAAQVDADGAEVAEAAQGVRGDDLGAFLEDNSGVGENPTIWQRKNNGKEGVTKKKGFERFKTGDSFYETCTRMNSSTK